MEKQMTKTDSSESAAARLRSRMLFGAVAAVASVIGVSSSAMATTITPSSTNEWQHIMDCAKALLSDPAAHAQYCAPGHDIFVSGSTGFASYHYDS